MENKNVKILISCGSGIATSKLVAQKIINYLTEEGYNPKVDTCSVSELTLKQQNYDVLLTTARGDFGFDKPVINAVPFITGISIDQAKSELLLAIQELDK